MGDGFDSPPSLGSLSPFILSVVLLNIRGGGRSGGRREKSLVLNGEGREGILLILGSVSDMKEVSTAVADEGMC